MKAAVLGLMKAKVSQVWKEREREKMYFDCFHETKKGKFHTKGSNRVVVIFYQTGFPQEAWENNDKICVIRFL